MRLETVADVISTAAQNVLETMFFTTLGEPSSAEGTPDATIEPPAPSKMIHAKLVFSGEWSGTFELEMPLYVARKLATNFTGGLDPREITWEAAGEVVCELASMVCGSALSALDTNVFELGSPCIVQEGLQPPLNAPEAPATVTREFVLDSGGQITIAVSSEIFSPELQEVEVP